MAAMVDNFAEFVNYLERHEELMRGAAFSYASPARRVLRDRLNPMEVYDDYEFLCRYRFTKRTVQQLLDRLPLRENTDGRGFPVPPLLQLLITLRFYGAGTFQIVTGDLVNVSQPTVSRVIERVSTMIARSLFPVLVQFPAASKMSGVMQDFYRIGKFPGVSGCIDCTHVPIKSPGGDHAEVYRNRKGYFSINVQMSARYKYCSGGLIRKQKRYIMQLVGITGPDLQLYDVVASWPGSAHDSRIFDSSRARVLYETGAIPGILLGDMGYACRSYLMTPLNDPAQGTPDYRQDSF
ncbi:putative nuclease HARBI1 [Dermacentor silvarum]|uniref:putative nuclease HARBI1 n=1 Tax=Dermacentor silvarum TaxID=543639 RepID=UPI0018982CA3|nr:putative nuclease HARBI1 [Dermacentor silvarum]